MNMPLDVHKKLLSTSGYELSHHYMLQPSHLDEKGHRSKNQMHDNIYSKLSDDLLLPYSDWAFFVFLEAEIKARPTNFYGCKVCPKMYLLT